MSNIEAFEHLTAGQWVAKGGKIKVKETGILVASVAHADDAIVIAASKQMFELLDRAMQDADEDYSDGLPLPGWYEEAKTLIAGIQARIEGL